MTTIAIIGAGAAGMFAAITAAQAGAQVQVLEASGKPLAKVAIAGGGRCNVTHYCFDARRFAEAYPRGGKELRAAFARFQARDLMAWFEGEGVPLKHEADGRVFPTSDDSATIVSCLRRAAEGAGVVVRTHTPVRGLSHVNGCFQLDLGQETLAVDRVLLSTGGSKRGMALAAALGHSIAEPVPALFTLRAQDPLLADLAGVAAPATVSLSAEESTRRHSAHGPLLITHWGLSGPAVLKASSWAARELAESTWRGQLTINWCPAVAAHQLRAELRSLRQTQPRKHCHTTPVHELPKRLWERLLARAGGSGCWAEQSNASLESLLSTLQQCRVAITGKGPFKEEFVVCGGVKRKEVDWRRMESRLQAGLHFAGEILDQDGLTGGFNLQAAWTTGFIAGSAMADIVAAPVNTTLRQ